MPKPAPPSKLKRTLIFIGYGVFCLVALMIGTVGGWLNSSSLIRHSGGVVALLAPNHPDQVFDQDSVTLLILGCDVNETTGGAKVTDAAARSDMMMLARCDFKNNTIGAISIPRDIAINVPGYGKHKINAYHVYGGDPLAKQAVEQLLPGVHIDKVVDLNFDGFIDLVNVLGGIPINIDKNMNYDDNAGHLHIHFEKGYQVLDGIHAEEFVRFRHSDSDLVREERQQQFMMSFKTVAEHHPALLPQLLDKAAVFFGNGLTDPEVMSLGRFVIQVPKSNIFLGQVPVTEKPRSSFLYAKTDDIPTTLAKYHLLPPSSVALR